MTAEVAGLNVRMPEARDQKQRRNNRDRRNVAVNTFKRIPYGEWGGSLHLIVSRRLHCSGDTTFYTQSSPQREQLCAAPRTAVKARFTLVVLLRDLIFAEALQAVT